MSEHALQVAVAHLLTVVLDPERTWWSAIDHGAGKLSKRSAGMMKARGVRAGLPDFILMYRSMVIGIELKTSKGRLSPTQVKTAYDWNARGHTIFVCRSLTDVQELLDYLNVPMLRRMILFKGDKDERPERAARARYSGARQRGKPKNGLPVVLSRPT